MMGIVSKKALAFAVGGAVVLVSGAALAAVDLFVNAPPITGDSTAAGFTGQIFADSITYSASAPTGAAKPAFDDVVITKVVDIASPQLLKALVTGETLSTVTISYTKPGTGSAGTVTYETVTLTGAKVTSVRSSTATGGTSGTEQVSFSFQTIEVSYSPQQSNGMLGQAISVTYNLLTNMTQ